jgi:heavy metal sensor kinase
MSFGNQARLINTLRGRLAAWYLAVMVLALLLFTLLLYVILSRSLQDHHDEDLSREATSVASALAGKPLTDAGVTAALAGSTAASQLVMLRDSKGDLLYRSPVLQFSEPNIGRHEALVHAATHGSRSAEFFTADLERSGPVRFICIPLAQRPDVYLQLGNPLGDIQATLRDVIAACLISVPAVLIVTSFGGWVMARRALRPLRSIDLTLQEIQATDLSRRIDEHPADGELAGLVATLNGLLNRLDRSFLSLRQFAADVSHQLQTPLTVMKSALDNARRSAGAASAESKAIDDLAEEVANMSAIITSLRTLALADASLPKEGTEIVSLSGIVEEAAELISALGESRTVSVTARVESGVTVRGDPVRLKQVLLNLGDNAVKYTPAGGHVTIDLTTEGDQAIVRVTDTGIGIPAAHVPHIFERFYRADASRGGAGGTGLGLAIVKRIVEVHGGTIDVESVEGGGSRFTVRLRRVLV